MKIETAHYQTRGTVNRPPLPGEAVRVSKHMKLQEQIEKPEAEEQATTGALTVREQIENIKRVHPPIGTERRHEFGKPPAIWPELRRVNTAVDLSSVFAEHRQEIIVDDEAKKLADLETECVRLIGLMTENSPSGIQDAYINDRAELMNALDAGTRLTVAALDGQGKILQFLQEEARGRYRVAAEALEILLRREVWPACLRVMARVPQFIEAELLAVASSECRAGERFGVPYEPSRLATGIRDSLERVEGRIVAGSSSVTGELTPSRILGELGIGF